MTNLVRGTVPALSACVVIVLVLANCEPVQPTDEPDAAGVDAQHVDAQAAQRADAAAARDLADAGQAPVADAAIACDDDGDGVYDVASCQDRPGSLRLFNATAAETFDVYVNGASKPIAVSLAPQEIALVETVQAGQLSYEFRSVNSTAGIATVAHGTAMTISVYRDAADTLGTAAASHLQPATNCSFGVKIAFTQLTTLAPNPVVVLSTSDGLSWHPASTLHGGATSDWACWTIDATVGFGIGPAGSTTPTSYYGSASNLVAGRTYQYLLTDAGIVSIDNLGEVDRFL